MTQDNRQNDPSAPFGEWIEQVQREQLDRLLEWIRAVDTKVSILTAIACAMIAAIATATPDPSAVVWSTVLAVIVGSAAPSMSLVLAALATFPHTVGPAGSLVYFGGIAQRSREDYAACMTSLCSSAYLEDVTAQCHRNAQIATLKYSRAQRATAWLFVGIIPWLVALYVLYRS